MKTCVKVLVVVAVFGLAVAENEDKDHVSPPPGLDTREFFHHSLNLLERCFVTALTKEDEAVWVRARSINEFREFFKILCPKLGVFRNCLDVVNSNLTSYENNKAILLFKIISETTKHLLTAGCHQDGERLAVIVQGTVANILSGGEELKPIITCFVKTSLYMKTIFNAEIDDTSQLYLAYNELPNLKTCINLYQDRNYKLALDWFLDEITKDVRCLPSENEELVLCSSLDPRSVKVSNICEVKTQNTTDLYDELEEDVLGCYSEDVNDEYDLNVTTMQENYEVECHVNRGYMGCKLDTIYFGDRCLSQDENNQFQLFLEAVNETIYRGCQDDGETITTIMHAVYLLQKSTPERAHAVKDCLRAVKAARGPNTTSKTMRLYHEMADFSRCLSDKLGADNDAAKKVKDIFNDVLKKVKCINPEDASTVPCATIHVH